MGWMKGSAANTKDNNSHNSSNIYSNNNNKKGNVRRSTRWTSAIGPTVRAADDQSERWGSHRPPIGMAVQCGISHAAESIDFLHKPSAARWTQSYMHRVLLHRVRLQKPIEPGSHQRLVAGDLLDRAQPTRDPMASPPNNCLLPLESLEPLVRPSAAPPRRRRTVQ